MVNLRKTALITLLTSGFVIGCNGSGTSTGQITPAIQAALLAHAKTHAPADGCNLTDGKIFGIRGDKSLAEYQKLGTNQSPYLAGVQYPDFSPVGYILVNDDSEGTGTLITDRWILTAGHVIAEDSQKEQATTTTLKFYLGKDPSQVIPLTVDRIVVHPSWWKNVPATKDSDKSGLNGDATGSDLALVRLAKPIQGVTPAKWNKNKQESIGSIVWTAGFGDYHSNTCQKGSFPTRHAYENTLDRIRTDIQSSYSDSTYSRGGILAVDFDSPASNYPTNTLGTLHTDQIWDQGTDKIGVTSSSTPTTLEGLTVPGDSGGPVFALMNGEWQIVGTVSAGEPINGAVDGGYGSIDVLMRVASHQKWIEDTISAP